MEIAVWQIDTHLCDKLVVYPVKLEKSILGLQYQEILPALLNHHDVRSDVPVWHIFYDLTRGQLDIDGAVDNVFGGEFTICQQDCHIEEAFYIVLRPI